MILSESEESSADGLSPESAAGAHSLSPALHGRLLGTSVFAVLDQGPGHQSSAAACAESSLIQTTDSRTLKEL